MTKIPQVDALLARLAADRATLKADVGRRNAARTMSLGRLLAYGKINVSSPEKMRADDDDLVMLKPRWLKADGWTCDPDGSWCGPKHFLDWRLIRPSETHARDIDGARAVSGLGSGAGSGGGARPASAEQLAEDERARVAWQRFHEVARDPTQWRRRQERRAWVLGWAAARWAVANLDVVRHLLPPGDLPLFEPALLEHDGWPDDGPEEG